MRLSTIAITIALVAGSGVPALAQDDFSHSVSTDLFASTDADSTDVYRAGVNLDLRYKSDEQLLGVRYEAPVALRKRHRALLPPSFVPPFNRHRPCPSKISTTQ